MKKIKNYLSIFAVLFTVILSSCSNDDIPVSFDSVIRVNPATVMSNFTYQVNPGDLDGVSSTNELRIRLFVFDENGNLVKQFSQSLSNYLTTASFDLTVPERKNYQLVALTDIVRKSDGYEYWVVTDENKLSTMKISYDGSSGIFGKQEILGLKYQWMRAGENPTINVEAAGALICTVCSNLHAYVNVGSIYIFSDRTNGFFDFSNIGELESTPILDEFAAFIGLTDIPSNKYQIRYSYKFMMPQKNMRIVYGIYDTEGNIMAVSATEGVELEMGKEYECYLTLDPNNDGSGEYAYGVNPINKERSTQVAETIHAQQSLGANQCDTYSIKELIKIQSER